MLDQLSVQRAILPLDDDDFLDTFNEVRNLVDAGLLFEERDRFLSLAAGTRAHRSRKR